jgi:hypothetical protein
MKKSTLVFFCLGLASSLALLCPSAGMAQILTPGMPELVIPHQQIATYAIKWNEKQLNITVPYRNETKGALRIDGVQTTPGLFVVDFPKTIAPGKQGDIVLIAVPKAQVSSDTEVVRLLTSQGEKTVELKAVKEETVQLERTELNWAVGEQAAAKAVNFTVAPGTAKPVKARALGVGNNAEIQAQGGKNFQLRVTPGSTAKMQQFPVVIEFDQALPGVATVVYCSIGSKN